MKVSCPYHEACHECTLTSLARVASSCKEFFLLFLLPSPSSTRRWRMGSAKSSRSAGRRLSEDAPKVESSDVSGCPQRITSASLSSGVELSCRVMAAWYAQSLLCSPRPPGITRARSRGSRTGVLVESYATSLSLASVHGFPPAFMLTLLGFLAWRIQIHVSRGP